MQDNAQRNRGRILPRRILVGSEHQLIRDRRRAVEGNALLVTARVGEKCITRFLLSGKFIQIQIFA